MQINNVFNKNLLVYIKQNEKLREKIHKIIVLFYLFSYYLLINDKGIIY